MRGRAVPWTFFTGALLTAGLLLTDTVRASKPVVRVPDLRVHWDGFFLDAGGVPPGLVFSDVTQQNHRRFAGAGRLFDATGAPVASYHLNGTLAADNLLTATGLTSTGRVVLGAGVQFFAGAQGDAGVMDAHFLFVPRRGQPSQEGAILLRPFADRNAPDATGDGVGVFRSRLDPTFVGGLVVQIEPRQRGAFPGFVSFTPESPLHAPFTWESRATLSGQNRLILIAQGKSGRMVVDGAVNPQTPGSPSTAVDGLYTLILNDGRRDVGFYNFNLTLRSP